MWDGFLVITVSYPTFCCVGFGLWLRWGWAVTIFAERMAKLHNGGNSGNTQISKKLIFVSHQGHNIIVTTCELTKTAKIQNPGFEQNKN